MRVVLEDNKLSVSKFHWLIMKRFRITASTIRQFLRIKPKPVFSIDEICSVSCLRDSFHICTIFLSILSKRHSPIAQYTVCNYNTLLFHFYKTKQNRTTFLFVWNAYPWCGSASCLHVCCSCTLYLLTSLRKYVKTWTGGSDLACETSSLFVAHSPHNCNALSLYLLCISCHLWETEATNRRQC